MSHIELIEHRTKSGRFHYELRQGENSIPLPISDWQAKRMAEDIAAEFKPHKTGLAKRPAPEFVYFTANTQQAKTEKA